MEKSAEALKVPICVSSI
jgi:hypothetical protein